MEEITKTNSLFEVNTVLHTKDGRLVGNAIIVGKDEKYNIIKTDYGNTIKCTDNDVLDMFYIAYSNLTIEEKEYILKWGKHKYAV